MGRTRILWGDLITPQKPWLYGPPFRKQTSILLKICIEEQRALCQKLINFIIKTEYKLDLPPLAYRRFCGSITETYKTLHNMHDANCMKSLLELKM